MFNSNQNILCKKNNVVLTTLTLLISCAIHCSASAKDQKADIVVIGAGASGISASLQLADYGANVITLEKAPNAGGTGNYCEGQLAINSPLQQDNNIHISKEEAFNALMNYGHWNGNAALISKYLDRSGETIAWMMSHGVKYDSVIHSNADDFQTWHLFNGYCAKAFGGTLLKEAEKKGVKFMYETPGKQLIIENGIVKGVTATNIDNEQINIYANAVIIATGGYGNNVKMMEEFGIKNAGEYYVRGNHHKTGDGINMALSAHAAPEGLGVPFAFFSTPPDPEIPYLSAMWAIGQGYNLKVTADGRRFENETLSSHWSDELRILMREKTSVHYVIFDQRSIDDIKNGKSEINKFMPYLEKIPELEALLKAGQAQGYVFKADSLATLSDLTKMDKLTFTSNVKRYNELAKNGKDSDFGKDPKYLQTISTPPFYAIQLRPELLGTLGGIKVNENLQVIDNQGHSIDHLYVIGNDAGGIFPLDYFLKLNGASVGFAVNSGRIAAEHAFEHYVSKEGN